MTKYRLLLLATLFAGILSACSEENKNGELDITNEFNDRWNVRETVTHDGDNGIIYDAVMWGGMIAQFFKDNKAADWSQYGSIVFEYSKPTTAYTQIVLNDKAIAWGKKGITKLEGTFAGMDVNEVSQVVLQSGADATIYIKRVYLKPKVTPNISTTLWEGAVSFGNWTSGFEVGPEHFASAKEGDLIEIAYTTDMSNSSVNYWQIKTIFASTEITLDGNAHALNDWGCATVGKGTTLIQIPLTAKDAERLKQYGLYVNGYYLIATQCNLLQ